MQLRTAWKVAATVAAAVCLLAGCSSAQTSSGSGPKVGLDLPRTDTDFWVAYAKYVPQESKALGINLMPTTNSQNDISKLAANVQALVSQGAKAIVMAPQDTGAVVGTLTQLANKNIPVVSVDTRPDSGKVYMVVRANNVAYGQKSCQFLGQQLHGTGKVVDLEGALDSINGRDRTDAFNACMKKSFPGITVYGEPTDWDSGKGAAALQTVLTQHPDIGGIYMQASVFLSATLQVLKSAGKLVPAGQAGHISIISNDGVPQEFTDIRQGLIDATVSQPADQYAKWALYYAQAALAGKVFKPGPTDHNSTIISWGNGNLEDQLPAPLVTKANVNDKSLWGNQLGTSG
ncbi:MAG TPA: sugar ABC transporter substrate-binding protein [Pseudonocardiaceae bacterium]|jgi:simple sugar transport system substrate-binding protein/ribose transport system substrate-binding protein|nr:sugar ABC transporter substrate-binding protein [Pseudonocardiaceae bacterium]